jgi:hypothetical protein
MFRLPCLALSITQPTAEVRKAKFQEFQTEIRSKFPAMAHAVTISLAALVDDFLRLHLHHVEQEPEGVELVPARELREVGYSFRDEACGLFRAATPRGLGGWRVVIPAWGCHPQSSFCRIIAVTVQLL